MRSSKEYIKLFKDTKEWNDITYGVILKREAKSLKIALNDKHKKFEEWKRK